MKVSRLRTRIIIGAFVLSIIISVIICVAVVLTFEIAERTFFEDHYQADVDTFVRHYKIYPSIVDLPRTNFKVFVAPEGDYTAVPTYLKDLPEDTFNVTVGGRVYDYQVRDDDATRFYFLFDEDDTEAFENSLLVFSGVISLTIIIMSVLIGRSLSRHIIQPLTDLAERVSRFGRTEGTHTSDPGLIPYGDEIQTLERSINDYHDRITKLLEREQEFSEDVSHELRTPLMALQGAAEILNQRLDTDDKALAPLIDRISRSCLRMTALTEALLCLAREPERFEDLVEPVSVRKVVDEQLSILKDLIELRGIKVVLEDSGDLIVSAIPAVVDVVIGNIIKNAVKYTDQKLIDISISKDGVTVRDYGPGMDNTQQAALFDRYHRGNERREDGSGIGLSLVQRFCAQCGWTIEIDSEAGEGTRVILQFKSFD